MFPVIVSSETFNGRLVCHDGKLLKELEERYLLECWMPFSQHIGQYRISQDSTKVQPKSNADATRVSCEMISELPSYRGIAKFQRGRDLDVAVLWQSER
jgi:hypothetical protein